MRSKLVFTLLASLALFSILTSFSTAEIMLAQPKSIYNIGDLLEISATIMPSQDTSGFLTITLKCAGSSNVVYLSPLSLNAGQQEKIEKKMLLSGAFLGSRIGDCNLDVTYGSESATTSAFQITDRIETILNVNPLGIDAGESISVKGTAVKANSQNLEGYIEIKVEKTDIRLTRAVNQGKFDINFSFPANAKSGNYALQVKVYDKSGDEIGNQDIRSVTLVLKQKPTKIEIAIDKQSIKPGESVKFVSVIYDQANEKVLADLKIEVRDGYDETFFTKLVKTNEEVSLDLPGNASAGYWEIEASALDLKSKRLFYIEEFEKAKFEILNDTLIITNIGNVLYKKTVQIAIGNNVEMKEMNLEIGGSKKFRLLAPDGNYQVSVTDGSETFMLGGVGLTGNIVGVMELKSQLGLFNRYPIVWLFLIVIFSLFIIMMASRVIRKNSISYPVEKPINYGKEKNKIEEFKVAKDVKAEHSLVTSGKKEEVGIIALKIKNLNQLKKEKGNALESIEKAKAKIISSKGSPYESGDSIIGIFAPSVTKTFRNDLTAVKVASEIAAYLNEHNKKFTQKINFGIGINSGDIVSKLANGKLMFTALGNMLNLARKISDKAEKDVLLSQAVNNRVMHEVKTEKKGDYYSIKRIVDREQHKQFIEGFLKRL